MQQYGMKWLSALFYIVLLFFWTAKTANCRTQYVEGELQWTWQLFPEIGSVLENIPWLFKKPRASPFVF